MTAVKILSFTSVFPSSQTPVMGFICFLCYSLCSFKCNVHFSSHHWINFYINYWNAQIHTHTHSYPRQAEDRILGLSIKLAKEKYCSKILMPFFKTKENLYYVASKVRPFEASPEVIFPVPSEMNARNEETHSIYTSAVLLAVTWSFYLFPPVPLSHLYWVESWLCYLFLGMSWPDIGKVLYCLKDYLFLGPLFCKWCINGMY